MRFLQFLFGKTPDVDTPASDPSDLAQRPYHAPPKWQPREAATPIEAVIPAAPEPLPTTIPAENGSTPSEVILLGDLHVAIEYEDSDGNETTRNITMQQISRGPNAPTLKAICHTRRAVRHFRTDRIVNVITSEGEVLSANRFFRDVARIDLRAFAAGAKEDSLKTARALRDFLRPALSILVVAAKTDDQFHPAELVAIMAYVRAEAPFLREYDKFTMPVGDDEIAALEPLIRTMRPQESSVRSYIGNILSQREERFDRFRAALIEVVRADGVVSLPEEVFLEDLDQLRIDVALHNIEEFGAPDIDPTGALREEVRRERLFRPEKD